jgi:hypothetical protein
MLEILALIAGAMIWGGALAAITTFVGRMLGMHSAPLSSAYLPHVAALGFCVIFNAALALFLGASFPGELGLIYGLMLVVSFAVSSGAFIMALSRMRDADGFEVTTATPAIFGVAYGALTAFMAAGTAVSLL